MNTVCVVIFRFSLRRTKKNQQEQSDTNTNSGICQEETVSVQQIQWPQRGAGSHSPLYSDPSRRRSLIGNTLAQGTSSFWMSRPNKKGWLGRVRPSRGWNVGGRKSIPAWSLLPRKVLVNVTLSSSSKNLPETEYNCFPLIQNKSVKRNTKKRCLSSVYLFGLLGKCWDRARRGLLGELFHPANTPTKTPTPFDPEPAARWSRSTSTVGRHLKHQTTTQNVKMASVASDGGTHKDTPVSLIHQLGAEIYFTHMWPALH